jgi:multiple sugar transport system permease protein
MAQSAARPLARPRAREVDRPRIAGSSPATPYLFLAPFLVLFTAFVLGPSLYAVWISLHEWNYLVGERPWTGLGNFADLFEEGTASGRFFWQSMAATGKFVLFSVPPLVLVPLGVALVLNAKFPGRNFFRAVYFAPYVLGVAVVSLTWRFLLDPAIGLVNFYLTEWGIIDTPIAWTNSLPWAWVTLVLVTVWWTLGFNTVIYLAGLQDVSPDLMEAARVDGASRWQVFRHVTVPQLRNVFVFVITVTIIASANMFGQSYMITQGAPGDETRTAIMYIAQEGFQFKRMGNAAAMSVILALLLAALGALNFAVFREREE